MRFLRGLTLGLSLSALNLVGMFLMLTLLGGLEDWSSAQFVGIFGMFEVATGVAFIFCPNAWRLSVMEAELNRSEVDLTGSTIFIPHWAGGAKCVAGTAMVAYTLAVTGVVQESALLVPLTLLVATLTVSISVLVAAFGVGHPGLDVVYFRVARPGRREISLPGLSISAATLQIVLGAFTLPTIKLLTPGTFFRPAFAPTLPALLWTFAATGVVVILMFWAWRGRLRWRASAEQQELAEQPA